MKQRGFTVIELVSLITVLSILGILFWTQKTDADRIARDDKRRTAINAMYYNLEDVFFVKNKYYPKSINSKNLTAMDKELFKDPDGIALGEEGSSYRYEATNCTDDKCRGYTLRADLEREADYVKEDRPTN